jgi:hypothetical protein
MPLHGNCRCLPPPPPPPPPPIVHLSKERSTQTQAHNTSHTITNGYAYSSGGGWRCVPVQRTPLPRSAGVWGPTTGSSGPSQPAEESGIGAPASWATKVGPARPTPTTGGGGGRTLVLAVVGRVGTRRCWLQRVFSSTANLGATSAAPRAPRTYLHFESKGGSVRISTGRAGSLIHNYSASGGAHFKLSCPSPNRSAQFLA